MNLFLSSFVILIILKLSSGLEYILSTLSGTVEKNNYAYYGMSYEGTILLKLYSLSGDCDLYISQYTSTPTYEPEYNCLSSITCGIDTVIVPKSFKRPVGIGIFGHPSQEDCSYTLTSFKINDSYDIFNYNPYKDIHQREINEVSNGPDLELSFYESDKESFFWTVLTSVIEFIIEIIL